MLKCSSGETNSITLDATASRNIGFLLPSFAAPVDRLVRLFFTAQHTAKGKDLLQTLQPARLLHLATRGSIESVSKAVNKETLLAARERLRAEGKRLVFTNGCFDLIHAGHVRYLNKARSLGDALVVALNSDRSTRALKGEGRPIMNERERAEVISALEAVDYVIIFDEETPRELIADLLPDVLVKGGDWSIDQIVGREEVEASGGKVMSLPYVEGSSTTEIIDRIRNA